MCDYSIEGLESQVEEIIVRMEARVDRFANPGLDLSPDLAGLAREIAGFRGLGADAPHHFLGASPRIAPAPEMTAYAREVSDGGLTAFGTVCALGMALHRDMKFDPEATTVETPPSEAFARRHGVCQDFAQVMIAALRGIGVPAGYVSGFLRTNPPPGKPRLEGADAMHAWVRAWCGFETGWIEFDPTNAAVCATDHIVVAYGRDYGDVSPMRGVLRISGGQKIDQKVAVVPAGARWSHTAHRAVDSHGFAVRLSATLATGGRADESDTHDVARDHADRGARLEPGHERPARGHLRHHRADLRHGLRFHGRLGQPAR